MKTTTTLWMAVAAILFTFFILDAGALAWASSLISGRQVIAEMFTFLVVLSGVAVTVWRMKLT